MSINLTPIIQAVIALLAALITYKLIPWLKARTSAEQYARIQSAVRIAVFAAEQLFGAGQGENKLEYARRYLLEHGFDVDVAMVEAAVYNEINRGNAGGTADKPPDEAEG